MIASRPTTPRRRHPAAPTSADSELERHLVLRAYQGSPLRLGILELASDGLLLRSASSACAQLLGLSAVCFRDRPLDDLGLPADLVALWHEACFDAWRREGPSSFRFVDPETEPPRHLTFTVSPLPDEVDPHEDRRGPAVGHLCAFQIDDVRHWTSAAVPSTSPSAGQSLPASHFRHVVETTPALIWTADPAGDRNHFNRSWLTFTGRRLDHELAQGWTSGIHPDDVDETLERLRDAFDAREPFRVEYRLRRADGAWRHLVDQGVPRFRSDGIFLGYAGSSTDITERRVAERRAEASSRWYRELVEGIDHLVIHLDRQGRIAFVNTACRRLFGAEPEECVGFLLVDFVHPDDRPAIERWLDNCADRAGSESPIETRLRGRHGNEHDVHWTIATRADAGECAGFDLVGQDVTERKRLERHRRRLDHRLLQAQKLESLGVLAGGIAHDFNNLLMVILGNASLALQDLGATQPARQDIEEIETAALRATELTQKMLAYSGKGQFVVEPADLSTVIDEMSDLLEASVSAEVRLEYHLASRLPAVRCDIAQMRQIMLSLVNNASEAIADLGTEGGRGTVTVTTAVRAFERTHLDRAFVADELPEGTYVVLEVSDDGTGMDAATRERIFDPFFTTKFTGRGLGLAAALGIVRGHGGGLAVDSQLGIGTTVTVLLPQAKTPRRGPTVSETDMASTPARHRHGDTMLVVDDDETIRHLASRLLHDLGYRVLAAPSGEEAIAIYRQHQDSIVAVLLDMVMPGINGEETFRQLRAIDLGVRVLLSSGYSEEITHERFDRGLAQHLGGFLQKPYRRADLAAKLEAVLGA